MRESVSALESAISELVQAKDVLPDELATKLDEIIAQARVLMDSLQARDDPGSGVVSRPGDPQAQNRPATPLDP